MELSLTQFTTFDGGHRASGSAVWAGRADLLPGDLTIAAPSTPESRNTGARTGDYFYERFCTGLRFNAEPGGSMAIPNPGRDPLLPVVTVPEQALPQ